MSDTDGPSRLQNTTTGPLNEQFMLRLDTTAVLLPATTDQRILRLAVQAVHCYPTNGEQTKLTRQVMNALVANAQDVYERIPDDDKALIRRVLGTPRFTITMKRLLQLIGKEGSTNYQVIYEAVDALHKWELKWNVMDDRESLPTVSSQENAHFISQWGKGVGSNAGVLTYFFTHDVMMMLMEPAMYAQIDLHTANGLGSSYAVELYHQCVRYIGTGVTPLKPLEEWISLIAGPGKYIGRYKDFKRFALTPAREWLALTESCPFTVEVVEALGPRKRVVGLQFRLTMKEQANLAMKLPLTWSPDTFDTLRKVYSMRERDIQQLALSASEAEVLEAIAREGEMVRRKAGKKEEVKDRANYLRGIIRNLQAGKPKDAEPSEVIEATPSRHVQDAMARVRQMQTEFEAFRTKRLGEHLAELPSDVVAQLRQDFAEARGSEGVIGAWLRRGWDKAPQGLIATFLGWFKETHADEAQRLLSAPEERDFSVWLMLRQAQAPQGGLPSLETGDEA